MCRTSSLGISPFLSGIYLDNYNKKYVEFYNINQKITYFNVKINKKIKLSF